MQDTLGGTLGTLGFQTRGERFTGRHFGCTETCWAMRTVAKRDMMRGWLTAQMASDLKTRQLLTGPLCSGPTAVLTHRWVSAL